MRLSEDNPLVGDSWVLLVMYLEFKELRGVGSRSYNVLSGCSILLKWGMTDLPYEVVNSK